MPFEYQDIGPHRLYRGDCLEIMPTLGKVDAVVTDPPYGIGEARNNNASRTCLARSVDYGVAAWDDKTADDAVNLAVSISQYAVIFGGNYYDLPPSSCWLVWDKEYGANDFADCELAWTNLKKAVRRIQWRWHGMLRKGNETRVHPTQKPLGVIEWCIKHLPADCQTICDPFMGSGTTIVACQKLGRKGIGIELEPKYFDIACKRVEDAMRQPDLFIETPAEKPTQQSMEV